jgi:hypothetical protein
MTRVTDSPRIALERYEMLWVAGSGSSSTTTVHLQSADNCVQLAAAKSSRRITHPAEIPLAAERVCSQCQEDFGDREAFDRDSGEDKQPEVAD